MLLSRQASGASCSGRPGHTPHQQRLQDVTPILFAPLRALSPASELRQGGLNCPLSRHVVIARRGHAVVAHAAPVKNRLHKQGIELGWPADFSAHYLLGRYLGSGSYGRVYEAVDRLDGQRFAVKVLSKERRGSSRRTGLKRIAREVAALEAAAADGCGGLVVPLVAKYESPHEVYVVMEHLPGGDLLQLLEACGPLDAACLATLLRECTAALAALHAAGLVSADVKPSNFLLTQRLGTGAKARAALRAWDRQRRGPLLKLIDLGCAQRLDRGKPLRRRSGTPTFMAPEVFARSYNERADLWSLGVLFHQLATGRLPFWPTLAAASEATFEEAQAAAEAGSGPLDDPAWREMPPSAGELCEALLAHEPEQRPSAAAALSHPWLAVSAGAGASSGGEVGQVVEGVAPAAEVVAAVAEEGTAGTAVAVLAAEETRGGGQRRRRRSKSRHSFAEMQLGWSWS